MESFRAAVTEVAHERVRSPDDRQRFERLLERHERRLRRFASGILADRDRLDDVLQEAYLKAYRKLPRAFANDAHERAWLYRVVYRCCLDELRRQRPTEELRDLPARNDEPDRRLALESALQALKPAERALIFLVGVAGLKQREAAQVLGVARGTVAWRLSLARERLREQLRKEEFEDA